MKNMQNRLDFLIFRQKQIILINVKKYIYTYKIIQILFRTFNPVYPHPLSYKRIRLTHAIFLWNTKSRIYISRSFPVENQPSYFPGVSPNSITRAGHNWFVAWFIIRYIRFSIRLRENVDTIQNRLTSSGYGKKKQNHLRSLNSIILFGNKTNVAWKKMTLIRHRWERIRIGLKFQIKKRESWTLFIVRIKFLNMHNYVCKVSSQSKA